MPITYQVQKSFSDVKGAFHKVGETISDLSLIPSALVLAGYVAMIPDPTKTLEERVRDLEEVDADNNLTEEP